MKGSASKGLRKSIRKRDLHRPWQEGKKNLMDEWILVFHPLKFVSFLGSPSPPKDGLCIFVPPSLPTSVYFPLEIVAFSYNLSLFPPLPSLFQCLIFTNTYLFVICSPPAGSLSLICFSLILKLLASPDCDHSPLLLIRDLSEISYHLITPSKEVSQVLPGAC